MELTSTNGPQLTLIVDGYQFPNASDEWDGNWLMIQGEIRDETGTWQFRDPCLLTYEATELAAWLRSTCNPSWSPFMLTFLEPNLSFECVAREGSVTVRVGFDLEARPPWGKDDSDEPYTIDLLCDTESILRAAEALTGELTPYPRRLGSKR